MTWSVTGITFPTTPLSAYSIWTSYRCCGGEEGASDELG
jgi:hypothetical protein